MTKRKLVMPKGDGRLELAIQSLKIYYESNTWVKNADFIQQFLSENDEYDENTDTAMILHKARTARYFGLIKYLFKAQNNLPGRQGIITERGKRFYEAYQSNNRTALIDTLMEAIKRVSFGRNNYATSDSDSDVEPPRVLVKAAYQLEYLTKNEFVYLMYAMHNLEKDYEEVINEISRSRKNNLEPSLPKELSEKEKKHFANVYGDWKFIQLLREVGILEDLTDRVVLSDIVIEKYSDFIKGLSLTTSTTLEIAEDLGIPSQSNVIGENILLYGVPGSGKSFTIQTYYCDDFDLMERVVFHPDYMNTDFVGQILPTVKGEGEERVITYDFTPGPFTRILKKAIDNPDKHFYLVIEEINRGNAPAIFGEIFQLLDRESDGTSSYKITNYNIANEVFGDKETPVFIPSNLSILATMNTADQNVFTLDTAFQRRWNMKMIENDVTKAKHAKKKILDTTITWEKFNTVVNDQIITSGATTLSSEDKRLGAYFVTADVLNHFSLDKDSDKNRISERYKVDLDDTKKLERAIKDLNSRFGDKVIKYLWDDAFKFSRDDIFDSDYKSLEKVLDYFNSSTGNERFDVFNQDIRDNLFAENNEETGNEE